MTFGNSRSTRRALAALLAAVWGAGACVAPGANAREESWGVEQLMRSLGEIKSAKGKFVERKHLAILNAPLELSGTLIYTAPSRLEKHTLRPQPESLILQHDVLTIDSKAAGKRRTLALQDYPVVWAFVESIRATLAGDLQTLSRFYQVKLEGNQREWNLVLKPSEPKMQSVVSEIRVGGSGSWISTIEIFETGGDRSVMTITRDTS
jgi:hypothetical protein